MDEKQATELRKPFPKSAIGRLPKGGVMLDYVGHAAITDRLLAVDPAWSWEPVAFDERGLPRLDEHGGLWIRLTVAEVTRLGYGDAGGKKGPNAVKEAIGDALRNAAMRFGVALDLWAKEDLSAMHTDQLVQANGKPAKVDRQTGEIPQSDDVKRLKADVWKAAQIYGLSAQQLSDDFTAFTEGASLTNAGPLQLQTFLDYLCSQPAASNGVPA